MNTLYTFGYQGAALTHFVQWVEKTGAVVVDTRLKAWSKRAEWREDALRRAFPVGQYGIMQSLGNLNYKGGPIRIADPASGVPVVVGLLEQSPVVLMCACKNVETCHRKVVAEMVGAACGVQVVHLAAEDVKGSGN